MNQDKRTFGGNMNSPMFYVTIIALSTLRYTVYADYDCLCNYKVETPIYGSPDTYASPVGYMYEFDCKPIAPSNYQLDAWTAIMNEHLIAFAKKGEGLADQICQGSIPPTDMLPSTSTVSSTSMKQSTMTDQTSTELMSLISQTTKLATTRSSTMSPSSAATVTILTSETATVPPTSAGSTSNTPESSSSLSQSSSLFSTATPPTTTTGRLLSSSMKTRTTTFTHTKHAKTTPPYSAWSTTSDWLIHWNITHSPYTTKKHHHTTDWLVHWKTTHPQLTGQFQTPTQSYTVNRTHGNLQKCPGILTRSVNHKWLRQYKGHCYELVHQWKDWYDAEMDCWQRLGHGGMLLEIYTADIQQYILDFLHELQYNHDIWIGLQDIDREEHFAWDSGKQLTYTNWNPNRKGNQLPHWKEDCVYMQTNGRWDDSLCSYIDISKRFLISSNTVNTRRPYICQYPTHSLHHGR